MLISHFPFPFFFFLFLLYYIILHTSLLFFTSLLFTLFLILYTFCDCDCFIIIIIIIIITAETYVCPETHFKCNNHYCIPAENVCDFKNNCGDNSDEEECCKYKKVYFFTCLLYCIVFQKGRMFFLFI